MSGWLQCLGYENGKKINKYKNNEFVEEYQLWAHNEIYIKKMAANLETFRILAGAVQVSLILLKRLCYGSKVGLYANENNCFSLGVDVFIRKNK